MEFSQDPLPLSPSPRTPLGQSADPIERTQRGGTWSGGLGLLAALVAGGIGGGLLGLGVGLPLARAFGITDFEGGRGYFVAFIMLPGGCLFGAALALWLSFRLRRRWRRRAAPPAAPFPGDSA